MKSDQNRLNGCPRYVTPEKQFQDFPVFRVRFSARNVPYLLQPRPTSLPPALVFFCLRFATRCQGCVLASSANATWDGPCRSFKCRVISDAKKVKIKQCRVAGNDARFACCRDTQPGVLNQWHSFAETAGSCCHGGLEFNAGVPWDASHEFPPLLCYIVTID